VLADGGVATIEEIYRQGRARLLTLNDHWKFKLTSPSAFVDDGQKPVFRVTTRSGREVESTLAHPFLTLDGWRPLAELRPGTRIAVPRRIDIFGEERIRDGEVKLLADLIADGCVTKTSPEFASSHPALQADFAAAVSEFPGVRAIPPVIFKLRREQVALFLNRLWATDGWASVSAGTAEIGYTTVSEKLARQLQHLLLRFGVMASLRKRSVAYLNARRCAWSLSITQADSIRTFATEIGIWGKESALERLLVALNPRDNRSGLDPLPGEIYWDEIVAIEPVGCKQVYDLTIPATHNFVANDICVHNTAFCLNIAQNAATTPQHHGERATVGIFSLEMSKEQLVQRMLCSQARLDAHRLRSGMLSKDDWRRLALAVSELAEARIFIDDTPAISVLEMRAKARRLKNEQRALDLLIVDYLQLMSGRGRIESRQQEVSQISRELKGLAKELHVPLIALSQLSRAPEARTDHRPQLADLRESGSLEQDSDVVMFIYREDVYNPETEKQNIAEVIIGKQRNGPIGKVELVFLKSLTRFENKAYE
jgi:replicative DNA helicase